MNKVDLDKYYKDTFSLARTLIVKINKIAEKDNEVLLQAGYEVSSDKRTWRYYMNLNGDYHPTDTPMMIESIDTGEMILFSKENLVNHLVTQKEYLKREYWYKRLLDLYPDQTMLINGILSPIPYQDSIEAEDYSILYYDTFLVGWNEEQLIPKLQKHINSLIPQLFKNEYLVTDDMFLTLMVQLLYSEIIKAIHAIRLEDCYTRYTHEFFIWSHIDSFGDFSRYRASLNTEQVMWLFRNIAWLNNNPGKRYTFNKLLDNILTKSGIPLSEYDLIENTETLVEDLTPTPLFRRNNINLLDKYGTTQSFVTNDVMTLKQMNQAVDNPEYAAIYNEDSFDKGRYSLFSEVRTKSLESSMYDSTNSHSDTPMSIVLNSWIYLTHKGYFQGRAVVVNPKTGVQFRMPVDDAFHLWYYLLAVARGEDPTYICPVYYHNVMRIPPPSLETIIHAGSKRHIPLHLAQDIRDKFVPIETFYTSDYLIDYSGKVYQALWEHRKQYIQYYDLNKRARVKNATSTMYDSGVCKLGDRTNYGTLLDDYNIVIETFSTEELRLFAWDIFQRTTGWDSNNQSSLRGRQSDLINLMDQLSSYTIQFIKEMSDSSNRSPLVNEIMIGDSRLTGPGHTIEGDFSKVILDIQSNLHMTGGITNIQLFHDEYVVKPEITSEGNANLPDTSHLKYANILKLENYAIRFPKNDYIRGIIVENPIPDVVVIPPTYYGTLYPEDNSTSIPPTYYGILEPGLMEEDKYKIPPTYYGELKPGVLNDIRIPATYYGVLKPGLTLDVIVPETYYGYLQPGLMGTEIPSTYYGVLDPNVVFGKVTIPATYYGVLDPNISFGDVNIPNTYYGYLQPGIIGTEIPNTYYGALRPNTVFGKVTVPSTNYGKLKPVNPFPLTNVPYTYYGTLNTKK